MSYENYRTQLIMRLTDKIPAKLLKDVMEEVDFLSRDFEIKRACMDIIPANGDPAMVNMYLASLSIANRSAKTIKDYKMHLYKFFDFVRKSYEAVSSNDVRAYLGFKRQNGNTPQSANHIRTVIRSFYQWLVDNSYVSRNPVNTVEKAKEQIKKLKPMKQAELEYFRNACKTLREKALVDFLFSTGMRIGEIADARVSDIDWNDHSVFVRHGKGDKERIDYLNAKAEISLKAYLDSREADDDHIFVAGRSPHIGMTTTSLEAEIRRIRNRIPEKLSIKVTPHSFRRTTLTTAAERGMPLQLIQALAGHSRMDTTMRYVTIQQSEIRNEHLKRLA